MILLAAIALASAHAAPGGAQTFDLTAQSTFSAEAGAGFDLNTAPGDGRPFHFSVALPEGNYRVSVEFGGPAASDNTVRAESRRLVVEGLRTRPGEVAAREFIVNVRNSSVPPPEQNAPGGSAVVLNDREQGSFTWDDKLTLEFNGPAPAPRSLRVEPVDVPTLYLAGDSTVTDQRFEDGASWGQMLPRFMKPDIAVANHAESGETMKSFISALRLAKVLSRLKPGDWLFIQFGHNDQKKQWPQTYVEAASTYRAYLRVYIAEARLRGATPVLVTSPQRRTFEVDGRIRNTHGDYPQAVREVAAGEGVALIDLEAASRAFYEALGPSRSPLAFSAGGRDITHHNNYGAYQLAKAVVQGIRDAGLPLARHVVDGFSRYDPARPDPPESFSLTPSPVRSDLRPRGN